MKDPQVANKQVFDIQFHKGSFYLNLAKSLYTLNLRDCRVVFFNEGRLMLIGGYLDGSWRVYRTANGELLTQGQSTSKITCMLVTKKEDMILLGTESGVLEILEIKHEASGAMATKVVHQEYFDSRVQHLSEKESFFAISYG